jgi:hypothetical protein
MTIAPAFIKRGEAVLTMQQETALIPVSNDSSLLAHCHIKKGSRPTLLLVHGLEGSSQSFNILGLTENALAAGANVIRLNLRSCGESLHLTPSLYHAGLSADILAVVDWMIECKGLEDIFLVGFSLGGNTVLKAAAELVSGRHAVSGICAVAPSIDLAACVEAMETGFSRVYQWYFLRSLKDKIVRKNQLFPGRYNLLRLDEAKSLRLFDHIYTAVDGGFSSGDDYYRHASAAPLIKHISKPTLIIAAQDDPIVPFRLFSGIQTDKVRLLSPLYGGHGGFIGGENKTSVSGCQFWVDQQVLSFCFAGANSLRW